MPPDALTSTHARARRKELLAPVGVTFSLITGDYSPDVFPRDDIADADIVCERTAVSCTAVCARRVRSRRLTTPEKWDSITRRWRDNVAIMGQFSLILIDEVHTVGEERGAALEAVRHPPLAFPPPRACKYAERARAGGQPHGKATCLLHPRGPSGTAFGGGPAENRIPSPHCARPWLARAIHTSGGSQRHAAQPSRHREVNALTLIFSPPPLHTQQFHASCELQVAGRDGTRGAPEHGQPDTVG